MRLTGKIAYAARQCVAGVLAMGLLAGAASAKSEDAPQSLEPQRIGVFGDSLADGLWVGLRRSLRRDERVLEILQMSEVSTGLANYTYRDVGAKTRQQLSQQNFDIAVVLFGSNDIQGIRDGQAVHRFRSAEWERVYRDRARDIITQLQSQGATVYWVGLPVMRSVGYNNNTLYLNGIFEEIAEEFGITFISTRAVTGDDQGGYSAYLSDAAGTPRLMRADDGIHFTLPGYTRLAAPVADAIRHGWDNPPEPVQVAEALPQAAPVQAAAGWTSVLNLTIEGQDYICQPVTLERQAASASARPAPR